jgi:acetoin utilization protein AcuC
VTVASDSHGCALAWDPALTGYDFGAGHPLDPVRVELTIALARGLGVLDGDAVDLLPVVPATDAELRLVHTPGYLDAVREAGETGRADVGHGLGTPDDPVFSGMHEATAAVVGATLAAARAVHSGTHRHGVNVAGGLHHAMASSASGFCIYNDPAIAIAWLLANGVERVAYVDIDVHHGDGVQAAFWEDPRVLTVSVHESGRTLFPGTGFPDEVGAGDGRGYAANVALPAGTPDDGWLRALDAVALPLVRSFRPAVLVTQHGCDSHALDPLANLLVSVDGQRTAHAMLHALAHEVCDGRWVATGGGGYELVRVVPRSWTHLVAEAAGTPVAPDTPTPQEWRDLVHRRTGTTAPLTMTDDRPATFRRWPDGDAGAVDAAIRATRTSVFGFHGLDPEPA